MIEGSAPVRICDIGGWTDTWFGGPGRVLNMAVRPGVEVSITDRPGDGVIVNLPDLGNRYGIAPGRRGPGRYGLVEAALDVLPPPRGRAYEITVRSRVPAGSGTGTSAAMGVALLGALGTLRGETHDPGDIARMAHRLEVDVLGGESGVQDQWCSAIGGICYLEIDRYPEVAVTSLPPWDELGRRLSLVFLGRAHVSSSVHRQVIAAVEGAGAEPLTRLRNAAIAARDAVMAQDMSAFAQAMATNTEAQASLHDQIVGSDARSVIDTARSFGAIGWKVNGAGGNGGSLTILSATEEHKAAFERHIAAIEGGPRVVPVQPSALGLSVRRL